MVDTQCSLKISIQTERFIAYKLLTVSCLLETVIGIVVRRIDVYRMPKFLQSESSIDNQAFCTTCHGV